jgi:hypothetical protein
MSTTDGATSSDLQRQNEKFGWLRNLIKSIAPLNVPNRE